MKKNEHYAFAIIFPIAMVCVAIALMLWTMEGTSSGRRELQASDTPRSTYTQPNASPVPAVPAPNNDTRADSARGSIGPENKSR
jgi:hypothetical protein